ncbi:MAG: PaaI family thioesterase [Parvularculaceae bacterium]|nr:PaaI family thioesterase [Parvularculaceae bacterium]
MSVTSERHTGLLNSYRDDGGWRQWTKEKLGDIRLVNWSYGRVSLFWEIDDRMLLWDGVMFGGHVASVSDHVAALVTMSALSTNADRFRTSRLETNYFRPITKPSLTIEARATNVSSRLIHVEGDYRTPDGKLAARLHAVQVRKTEKA